MALPVAPAMSEAAPCTRTFICSRLFDILPTQSPQCGHQLRLIPHRHRQLADRLLGPEGTLQQSATRQSLHPLVLRRIFFCRASALASGRVSGQPHCPPWCFQDRVREQSHRLPCSPSPPASTCRALSHSVVRSSSGGVAPKSPISRPLPSGFGAHAPCPLLPRSIPATVRRTTGQPRSGLRLLCESSRLRLFSGIFPLAEHVRPGRSWILA
jgi:hypothetical protein